MLTPSSTRIVSPESSLQILLVGSGDWDTHAIKDSLDDLGCCVVFLQDDEVVHRDHLNKFAAIIVDLKRQSIAGLNAIRQLRRHYSQAAILALTEPDAIKIRIAALKTGADDYLIKSCSSEELLDRMLTAIQQKRDAASKTIAVADLIVDCKKRTASRSGRQIDLTPREFELLRFLASHPEEIVSRAEIREHVYKSDTQSTSNIVDVYIRYLRKKIELPGEPKLLHTFRGRGYMLGER